jgi:phenylpropionate dioxygenase-like ring-hydroxylating dioxygenase large terminal subunit
MTREAAEQIAQVPHRVTDPERIPSQRYFDPHFFELEKERLWPKVWQMACRLEEIPEIGDFVEYTILDWSIIVVRTKSGVKAFHNACRHRGVRLVNEPGNCRKQGFICPFHGWRWNPDGKNTFVYGRHIFSEEALIQNEIDLQPCRIDFWAGCAFINFDDNALGLRETLGPVAERIDARHGDRLKMDWWYATEQPTNWKLAMEAFMESYHVMRTHPQLFERSTGAGVYGADATGLVPNRNLDARQAINMNIDGIARISEGMAGLIHHTEVAVLEGLRDMPVPDNADEAVGAFYVKAMQEIFRDGLERGAPMFDIFQVAQDFPSKGVEFMFPHFFLLPSFGAMASYRIRPLTPETCLFEIWSLVLRPESEPYETPKSPILLPYDSTDFPEIPQQDYHNLPLQQRGLHDPKFKHMRLSRTTEGMISNYQRLIDGYLAGLGRETLTKATSVVNNGYDDAIADIGF